MRDIKKRENQRKICNILIFILLMAVLWNMYEYFRLRNKAEYYLQKHHAINIEKPIDLVGLLDSYGVPYSPSVNKSFMDYLKEDLESQGMLSSLLDLYGLYINKTWELHGIFKNRVTIGEMKTMQNFGMDFVRHKYGSDRIREDLTYSCDRSLEDLTVASYYSTLNRPVVLYSCSANDLFYYFGTSLEFLNTSRIMRILSEFGNGLSLLESEVRSNVETLTESNPGSAIMVMGLYVPSHNFFLQRAGTVIVDQVNKVLNKICRDYPNTVYVDVSCLAFAVLDGDFHPDGDGHEILRNILEEKMASIDFADQNKISGVRGSIEKLEPQEAESADEFTMGEWLGWIDASTLPRRDYVEWAVAAEQVLVEKGKDDVSYHDLHSLMNDLPKEAMEERKGLEILLIERKIHEGFDLKGYTINKDVKNDKLSLIEYIAANQI